MSIDYWDPDQTAVPPPLPRRWPRRLVQLILLSALIFVTAILGPSLYLRWEGSSQLKQVLAATDARDAAWRWDDLHRARTPVPDDQNAALRVVAARKLIPPRWPSDSVFEAERVSVEPVSIAFRIRSLDPYVRLNDEQMRFLNDQFKLVQSALKEARPLAEMVTGRFPPVEAELPQYNVDFVAIRQVHDLLSWDAFYFTQQRDFESAMHSVEAIFGAIRSMGDEPGVVPAHNRSWYFANAVRSLDRILAQGEVPAARLEQVQKVLEDELRQPTLVRGLRGERAGAHEILERFRNGDKPALERMLGRFNVKSFDEWSFQVRHWLGNGYWQDSHARYIDFINRAIEIAEMPIERQRLGFIQMDRDTEYMKMSMKDSQKSILSSYFMAFEPRGILTLSPMSRLSQFINDQQRCRSVLQAGVAAVAAERFRQANGRWPNDIWELAPNYLSQPPVDVYSRDGTPLRLRKLTNGIAIYSIGVDTEDNEGTLSRQQGSVAGPDLGVQLWDVAHRHIVPKPPEPEKKTE